MLTAVEFADVCAGINPNESIQMKCTSFAEVRSVVSQPVHVDVQDFRRVLS